MARLSITLLGSIQVILDGRLLKNFRTDSARALLAYLVMHAGQPFHRGHLAALLWPDVPQREALVNLRQALYRLRQALGDAADHYLVTRRRTLEFNAESDYWLDVQAFTDLLEQCRVHPHPQQNTCPTCAQRMEAAVTLYQGDFLDGFPFSASDAFEEWRVLQQEDLHRQALEALEALAIYYQRRHAFSQAAAHLQRLLSWEPWREEAHQRLMYVLALAGDTGAALAQYETCRRTLAAELGVAPGPKTEALRMAIQAGEIHPYSGDGRSPYKGLAHFTQADAAHFFGRESYVQRLYEQVRAGGLVALVGASGSGKSSLIHAGLLPRLAAQPQEGERWQTILVRPGSRPFANLAQTLLQVLEKQAAAWPATRPEELAKRLAADPQTLQDISGALRRDQDQRRLLLLLEQFEELYTLDSDPQDRQTFADRLAAWSELPGVTVLIALRADFTHHALAQRALADAFQARSVVLGPMTREELRRAIEEPARNQGIHLEKGLTERLLQDMGGRSDALPLLQFTLAALWQERTATHLTHDAYDRIGQLGGALINHVEDLYASLPPEEQQAVRRIMLRLVRPGVHTPDTARQALRGEFDDFHWRVVRKLVDGRLLVSKLDQTGQESVELIHETLIENWPRLQAWLEEDREFHLWREGLRAGVHMWEHHGQDESALWRGTVLSDAMERMIGHWSDISSQERSFLAASQDLDQEQAAAEAMRQEQDQGRFAAFSAAQTERTIALEQMKRATTLLQAHQRMYDARTALARHDSRTALALARQVCALDHPPPEAELLLADAAYAPGLRCMLAGHMGPVHAVAFLPDGRRAVSAGADHTLILWDLTAGAEALRYRGHTGPVHHLAVSPDGARLLSASADRALRLWDVESGQSLACLTAHRAAVHQVHFLPDGRRAVSAGADGDLILWDVETGTVRARRQGCGGAIHALAVSPDGRSLLSGDAHGALAHWSLEDGRLLARLPALDRTAPVNGVDRGGRAAVVAIIFLAGGAQALALHADRFATLWDLAAGRALAQHAPVVGGWDALAPLPEEPNLLLAALGQDVLLVDLEQGERLRLAGHMARVSAVAASPDARQALSGDQDGALLLWDLHNGAEVDCWRLPVADAARVHVDVQPQEKLAALAGSTGLALWSLASGQEVARLPGPPGAVCGDVRFLPAECGLLVAWGNGLAPEAEFRLHLWEGKNGGQGWDFTGRTGMVWDMAVSGDGSFAVTAAHDGALYRWETATGAGRPLHNFAPHAAMCAAISSDGRHILVGLGRGRSPQPDFSLRLVESLTGRVVRHFHGHQETVSAVAFSPEGGLALSGDRNGRVLLWSVTSGELLAALESPGSTVSRLAFSPDGALAAVGGVQGEVLLWDVAALAQLGVGSPVAGPDVAAPRFPAWDARPHARVVRRRLVGHRGRIVQMCFAADGERLFTGDDRGVLRAWRVDRTLEDLLAWVRVNRAKTAPDSDESPPLTRPLQGRAGGDMVLGR